HPCSPHRYRWSRRCRSGPCRSSTASRRRRRRSGWSSRRPCSRRHRRRARKEGSRRRDGSYLYIRATRARDLSFKWPSSWCIRPLHQLLAQCLVLVRELAREVLVRVLAPAVRDAVLLREVDHLGPVTLGFGEELLEVLVALVLERLDRRVIALD